VRTQWFRRLAGVAGLLAGVWLATAASADSPVPDPIAGKLTEANIAYLQKGLEKMPEKPMIPTLKAVAMMIALHADGKGDAALRDQALKVADAIAKKDFAAAKTEAGLLNNPPKSSKKDVKLHEQAKFELAEVMSVYRNSPRGLNIEKDIRAQAKGVTDVKLVGDLAAHTLLTGEYTLKLPAENAAANAANKKKWDNYTNDMNKIAKEVADEAAKGAKADKAKLKTGLGKLDASCTNCHNDFRE
jgi:hypothetical protein